MQLDLKDVNQRVSWERIQQIDETGIHHVCKEYLFGKRFIGESRIGDHRRHFRCWPKERKVEYSVKILTSYKQAIAKYGSQAEFFEIHNNNAEFDVLYRRMKDEIECFHPRLPRFD